MNGKQLKNSILQWAIQGKLVPQDPNDEPASVLLEKIRQEKERLIKEKKIKCDKNASIIYRGEDNSYYEKILATGEVKCIDEEVPFEIPQGWEWTRIGNIFNHTSGKQQSSSNKGGGTPQKFITTSNLYWGHFVLDNVKVMNFTDEEIKTCSATKGDLLVCEGGAGYGRSAIWNEDYDICLQNHVHRLRPCVSGICEYVYYFIYLLKESNNLASVGTAMPGLSANRLKGLLLPFPSLTEQMRIVLKLEGLLSQIDKYSKVQNQLDELNTTIRESLKKSILQEAIQGKLVPQLAEEGTAQELLEQIKTEKQKLVKEGKLKKSALNDSVIFRGGDNRYYTSKNKDTICIDDEIPFEIPDSWVWVRFGTIMINRDRERIPLSVAQRQFLSKRYDYYGASGVIDKVDRYLFDKELLLIGEDGANLLSRSTPIAFIAKGKYWVNNHAHVLDVYDGVMLKYIALYINSISLAPYVTGTAQPKMNQEKMNSILIALPPQKEQQRIVAQIEKLFEQLH